MNDGDLIGWLVGFLFIVLVVGALVMRAENFVAEEQRKGNLVLLSYIGITTDLASTTPLGTTVALVRRAEVFDVPGGAVLGEQNARARGRLVQGPSVVADVPWWYVDFSFSPDGWVTGDRLIVAPSGFAVGDDVVVTDTTSVHASPAGEYQGPQGIDSRGTILEGPFVIGTEEWWRVDFENDPDGYVPGSDLSAPPHASVTILARVWTTITWLLGVLMVLALIGTIYALIRLRHIGKTTQEQFAPPQPEVFAMSDAERSSKNERWDRIQALVASENPGDWKLAVLEADIILDRLIAALYPTAGDNLGERMKAIEPSDFLTLDKAWEAHKVRNMIAHEGADFILTNREARRVITLFEDVFKEFNYL